MDTEYDDLLDNDIMIAEPISEFDKLLDSTWV